MRRAAFACVLIAACSGKIGTAPHDASVALDAEMSASDGAMIAADAASGEDAAIAADASIAEDAAAPDAGEPDAGCTATLASSLTRTPLANVPSTASAYPIASGGFAAA